MNILRLEPEGGILSNCVGTDQFVFTAGSVADDLTLDVKGQTRQTLAYIDQVLAQAGTNKSKIVWANIWLADIAQSPAIEATRQEALQFVETAKACLAGWPASIHRQALLDLADYVVVRSL